MQLNFPTYNFKVKKVENRNYIFDIIRKKYVALTPEEWVRQHVIHYLTQSLDCTPGYIAVEKGLWVNGLQKRFDVLVFGPDGQPVLLIECKAPDVALTDATFLQAAVYNKSLKVKNLLVTNGLDLIFCRYSSDFTSHELTREVPKYPFA